MRREKAMVPWVVPFSSSSVALRLCSLAACVAPASPHTHRGRHRRVEALLYGQTRRVITY